MNNDDLELQPEPKPLPFFDAEIDSEPYGLDVLKYEPGDGEERSIRFSNADAENGYDQCAGPLSWVNSARITLDPDEDAVHCVVSVADPRGGFCFTIRRRTDGQLLIHTPYPGESLPHCTTTLHHEGTLLVEGNFADTEDA